MFRFVFVFCLYSLAYGIVDLNCTSNGAYNAQAAICSNVYTDASCSTLYINSTVAEGGTDERPTNCFNGTNGPSEDLKAIAIASCPKTCGYCCQTTEYSCSNAQRPRIQCSTITNRMCQDPLWRNVIAEDCPASCGFCTLGGCIDAAPDCYLNPTVCVTRGLESFVAANCQRTCGLCSSSSTTSGSATVSSGTGGSTCIDNHNNCAAWNRNGFCNSSFYSRESKKANCAKTCNMC